MIELQATCRRLQPRCRPGSPSMSTCSRSYTATNDSFTQGSAGPYHLPSWPQRDAIAAKPPSWFPTGYNLQPVSPMLPPGARHNMQEFATGLRLFVAMDGCNPAASYLQLSRLVGQGLSRSRHTPRKKSSDVGWARGGWTGRLRIPRNQRPDMLGECLHHSDPPDTRHQHTTHLRPGSGCRSESTTESFLLVVARHVHQPQTMHKRRRGKDDKGLPWCSCRISSLRPQLR
jgi:hypothetical protein